MLYGLVGESGTGKSYVSQRFAKRHNITYIVDDGLLIHRCKILAGKSAKKEKTKVGSVKRALFLDDTHRHSVASVLRSRKTGSVLILGTSRRMISQIARTLELKESICYVDISNISSQNDIKIARHMRSLGDHAIPVPVFEVKRHFLGYFLNIFRKSDQKIRTIIRPDFSFKGTYKITNRIARDICVHLCDLNKKILKVTRFKSIRNEEKSTEKVFLELILRYPCSVSKVCSEFSDRLKREFEHMTAIEITKIRVCVKSIVQG